ncbi:hypothetical protein BB31_40020 [Amycolatopsis lurida NRRL 2430]|uniref:Uncharacterized protein n=1 Tax=Amycolatopsis lurida NRRL 2430 TaxID=1460371 RepID=A0A2P2FG89_AMYLU|nr:hypothetical protein BB31_40020 [Amycolatopsis lurida NRRL 2430]
MPLWTLEITTPSTEPLSDTPERVRLSWTPHKMFGFVSFATAWCSSDVLAWEGSFLKVLV